MSKAFVREDTESDDDGPEPKTASPAGVKNYITPEGLERLRGELRDLLKIERPKVVEVVSWAAGNGDRSENGDYIYGKKRLREIDHRIRFLTGRIEIAQAVDPARQKNRDRVFFGATVIYANSADEENTVTIVGIDETDLDKGRVSWLSPIARAMMKAEEGDRVELHSPGGTESLKIVAIRYPD